MKRSPIVFAVAFGAVVLAFRHIPTLALVSLVTDGNGGAIAGLSNGTTIAVASVSRTEGGGLQLNLVDGATVAVPDGFTAGDVDAGAFLDSVDY